MYDVNSTDVFFKSCYTLVPFQNPSDAAIARLSAAGFNGLAIQTILDLIVFNPAFNPKEVTLKSAGNIDETIAEYRRKQAVQRSFGKRTGATDVSGPPGLVVSLVASHTYKAMPPFERDFRSDTGITTETEEIHDLLRNMSLVHRSWTDVVQGHLFRRIEISDSDQPYNLRRLLQHPFLSDVREVICEVDLNRDEDRDNELTDESVDNVAHLMRRLRPLRYLSLTVTGRSPYLTDSEPIKMRCSRIHSQLSRHLPNLEGLWLMHSDIKQLRRCVKSIQHWRLNVKSITLRKLHLLVGYGTHSSGVIISPAILQPHDLHKDLHFSEDVSNAQALKLKSAGNKGAPDVFLDFYIRCAAEEICSIFIDTHTHRAVLNDSAPGIQRLAVHYPPQGSSRSSSDVNGFSVTNRETDAKRILSRFLDSCTVLSHIDVIFPNLWNRRMSGWLFSDLPSTVRALSIYLPGHSERLDGTPREIVDILLLRNRTTRSAMERLEIIFCDNLDDRISDAGLDATVHDLECAGYEIATPNSLLSAREACRANGIELVVRKAIVPGRFPHPRMV